MSPSPLLLSTLANSFTALSRSWGVDRWWMTAIEMKASHELVRRGKLRESAANNSQSRDFYWAVCRRPRERSVPTMCNQAFTPRYLPLPHPTSHTIAPFFSPFRKCQTRGQGLQRVWEKCGAILSQTSYTCFLSVQVGLSPSCIRQYEYRVGCIQGHFTNV